MRFEAIRSCAIGTLLLAAAPVVASEAPRIHDGPSEPAKAWGTAMEAGDLAALARMHDAHTIAFPPGAFELKGGDAIMKDYAALFARYTVRVANEDAHWIAQPPLVVSWGVTKLTLHPKAGGADIVSRTRFTDAAIEINGGWRYVVDHASEPKAP